MLSINYSGYNKLIAGNLFMLNVRSFLVGVAVNPYTYFAFTFLSIFSKLKAET